VERLCIRRLDDDGPIVDVLAATNDARLTASTRAVMPLLGGGIESSNVANVNPAFSAA
jgi:hypothetical protein